MITVAFYDAKPYDRRYFESAPGSGTIKWQFHEFRLNTETASTARGGDAVCVFVNDRLDRRCLEILKELGVKMAALRCAGYNQVDLGAAHKLGITLVRVPAYSPHAVAEYAVALLLTLNRKIHRAYSRVRDHNFSLNGLIGFDVFGKTVGIAGTGRIGKITAQIFRGFQAKVLAYDPTPDEAWADANQVQYRLFTELLQASDIVSLHVPLTPASHHMLRKETFAQMKPGAFLVNTSRGHLVETRALIQALKSGRLGGVALDVYEEEEGVFYEDVSDQVLMDDELSRLLSFPNVLVTSHQAFLTQEALTEIARVTTENLLKLPQGGPYLPETVL